MDIQALGAKIPPGGGGTRWGRIVSGSYDETVVIWKKDREGKWVVGLKLELFKASANASKLHPRTLAADDGSQQQPIENQINQAVPHLAFTDLNQLSQHRLHLNRSLMFPGPMSRLFKLQFDARKIVCASQDHRIVGWDFACNDDDIIEASRFFMSL